MNARAIGELVLRLWGAMLLVGGLSALPTHIMMTVSAPVVADSPGTMTRWTYLPILFSVLLQAAIGASLLRWGSVAARAVVPADLTVELQADEARLRRLGFALVGVVILISGLEDLAAALYALATRPTFEVRGPFDSISYLLGQQRENFVRGVVQMVAGTILLARPEGVARAWRLLRGRSTREGDDASL